MKLTMSKPAWRDLWLEIAELFYKHHIVSFDCYCFYLSYVSRRQYEVIDIICSAMEGIAELIDPNGDGYLFDPLQGKPDPVRAFTACFIAEIGEAEFMKLAEEPNE